MDWALIFSGIGIGMAVAAPIGPINVMVIKAVLQRGFRQGITTGSGAVLGDGCFALVAAFGLTAISEFITQYDRFITGVGGIVLLVLGLRTIFADPSAKLEKMEPNQELDLANQIATFGTTFVLTITNPATLMGFLFIFSSAGGLVSENENYVHAGALVIAVMAGSLLWWIVLSGIVSHFRERLTRQGLRLVNAISGVLIAGFGAFVLLRGLYEFSF
ncbi:threonine/homoserine/homoserine lactone efflux protein [Rhodoligotrophos appendicifer]|uniref:LysE family translocator n=1 Tax=Rhodoligotrophos appendicifer TaxID=987056 RepID=UPI0011865A09|nr:LysE family translocator [Rhodoligotrophos appendicifer]